MADRISDDDLRRITDKATPGPWKLSPSNIEEGPSAVRSPKGWFVATTASDADAALISLSPALAAEVLQLREALNDMMALFSADGLLRRGAEVQAALALARFALSADAMKREQSNG